ncbi:TraR/DksA family transcriptional regulator [Humibacter sp.]|uniref:TraR/DksA family transcriptional regulator n=1 Tax=Humibacter sp. TaxID=1940291 RepID=UPI003F80841D
MSSVRRSLTDAQRREFHDALDARRREVLARQGRLDASLSDAREARSGGQADDEHDPEGPTMAATWSQLTGLHEDLELELTEIDHALAHLEAGTYGVCMNCGKPIGVARLRARPFAELCIDCAKALESH